MAAQIDNKVILELREKYDFAIDFLHKKNMFNYVMAYPGYRMYRALQIGIENRGEESLNVTTQDDILLKSAVCVFEEVHDEGEQMITYVLSHGHFDSLLSLCPEFKGALIPASDQPNKLLVFHMQVVFLLEYYKNRQLNKLESFTSEILASVMLAELNHSKSENSPQNQEKQPTIPEEKKQPNLSSSEQKRNSRTESLGYSMGRKLAESKWSLFLWLIILILLGVGYLTNPDRYEHKEACRNYILKDVPQISSGENSNSSELNDIRSALLQFVENGIEDNLFVDNYRFFSITYFANEPVGIGIFGKVFLLRNLDESALYNSPKNKTANESINSDTENSQSNESSSSYSSDNPDMQNQVGFDLVMSGEEGGEYVEEWNQLVDDVNSRTSAGEYRVTIKHDDGSPMVIIQYEIDSDLSPVKGSAKLAVIGEKNTLVFEDGTVVHYNGN